MGAMENSSTTDSQVFDSSCLLSFPSEPPDIGNWFSSYEYESPELDSNNNFGDSRSMSDEGEIGGNESIADENGGDNRESSDEFRDVRKIDEEEAAEKLPSNWIPVKCTSLEDTQEIQPLGMDQDSSWCSNLLLSEPLDVRNWFSSYEYESPALDSRQEFGDCESENTGFVAEDRNNELEEVLEDVRKTRSRGEGIICEKVPLKALVKCNGNSGDNRQENQPLNEVNGRLRKNDPSSQQDLFTERTLEQKPKEKSLETTGISPTKNAQISSLTNEGSQYNLQNKVIKENGPLPLHINGRASNDDRSATPENLIGSVEHMQESLQTEVQKHLDCSSAGNIVPFALTDRTLVKKSTDLTKNKENKERRDSENGFVTTGKRELSATSKKPVERPENCSVESRCAAALPRKALSEKTNVEHSDVVEVIGKWSCPQKRKPNLGPPLKQLRLERWVRKEQNA